MALHRCFSQSVYHNSHGCTRCHINISSLTRKYFELSQPTTSQTNTIQIMARALGGSAIEAFWAGTSFLLTSTVFQPVLGSFSHIFGRKALIYVSLAFFLAGSIIPAVAQNFTVVLVGRSIQGVGGGGIISLTELVVVDTVPLRERGKWFSFFGAMWSLGTVAGVSRFLNYYCLTLF
jgi:MFS family permease